MAILGVWVSERVARGVMQNSATAAALYMTNVIEPHVQSVSATGELPDAARAEIETRTRDFAFRRHVVSLKIWAPNGRVIYSSHPDIEGQTFDARNLRAALAGTVSADLASLDERDSEAERDYGLPLYEIFAPLYRVGSNDVIAVAEFYENATPLLGEIAASRRDAWAVIGGVTLVMTLPLLAIVHRESRTLAMQRATLKRRRREQERLTNLNERLRQRASDAQKRLARLDERAQRRLGAELHDGAAQLLSYVLLRLDHLRPHRDRAPDPVAFEQVRTMTADALDEIRSISAGLVLPTVSADGRLPPVLTKLIALHQDRTGTSVRLEVIGEERALTDEALGHIARIVQEALTNAVKHADGIGQAVEVRFGASELHVAIRDAGPGFDHAPLEQETETEEGLGRGGLGLPGIRARAEAVGGTCTIAPAHPSGTEVAVSIPYRQVERAG